MVVNVLLDEGADVEARDDAGHASLHYTSESGRTDIAALLLDHGADVEATDDEGYVPLHLASGSGQVHTAALLIDKGANVNSVSKVRFPSKPYSLLLMRSHIARSMALRRFTWLRLKEDLRSPSCFL